MAASDFTVSPESIPYPRPFEDRPRSDRARHELFAFLAEAVADPNGVDFEQDEGIRYTWLEHVALTWIVDLVRREIDVLDAYDVEPGDETSS